MRALASLAIAATMLSAACGKEMSAKDCPPLEVTIDGKPATFTSVYGVDQNGVGFLVQGFNHDKNSCADLLKTSRTIHPDEMSVTAWVPNKGGPPSNVGVGFHTQFGVDTVLATRPSKEGDAIAACIPDKATFTPAGGPMGGKTITVHGLLAGKYCGSMKF